MGWAGGDSLEYFAILVVFLGICIIKFREKEFKSVKRGKQYTHYTVHRLSNGIN